VLARIVQGLGSGGLMVIAQATTGDAMPARDRGRYQGWRSGTYAVAALVGPVTGGYLTQWFGWRAVFVACLPLAVIALLTTRRLLARLPQPNAAAGRDSPSVLLLAAGLAAPLIALTRLGQATRHAQPLVDAPSAAALATVALKILVHALAVPFGAWARQRR
jgi:MFS family permease